MGIKSGQQRSWMRIARMILVILVGLSVAVLPAAVGFAGAPQMASAVSMPDCDHHMHAPDGKTQGFWQRLSFNGWLRVPLL